MGDLLGQFMWETPDRREAIISAFDRDFEQILLGLPLSDEQERGGTPVSEAEVDEAIYNNTRIGRIEIMPTRDQLAREVKRHQDRLDRAQARLDALEGIPEQDPFVDGAMLRYSMPRAGYSTTTFVSLRAGGRWYTTGSIIGIQKASWSELVDWWLEHRVTQITLLLPGDTLNLASLPKPEPQPDEEQLAAFPIKQCHNVGYAHDGHVWTDRSMQVWCRGFNPMGGDL